MTKFATKELLTEVEKLNKRNLAEDKDIKMIQAPIVSSKDANGESKSKTTKPENQEVEKKKDGNEKKRILEQNDNTKEDEKIQKSQNPRRLREI